MNIKDKNNHYLPYFGNGAYCWPNATAMLLSSIGENISPSLIEVLGGVGLGCCILKGTDYLFFNWELPDAGIDNALKILGFTCKVPKISKTKPTPIEELKPDLKTSPAVLGPLDMGHLVYNPQHSGLSGADHFILVYDINNKNIYLHDPSGFPHVQLSIEKFKLAWRAEKVGYCTKYYRYWAKPKRINIPTKNNIYKSALKLFQLIYQNYQKKADKENWLIGEKAISHCCKRIKRRIITDDEIEHLTNFALPLGARRALDFAISLKDKYKDLANLKYQQSRIFGQCHSSLVYKKWKKLIDSFKKLSFAEEAFRNKLLKIVV